MRRTNRSVNLLKTIAAWLAMRAQRALALLPALAALATIGCATTGLGSTPLGLRSSASGAALGLDLSLVAFERASDQRMVIYLSDLPRRALSAPIEELEGSIVRIERFFEPRPGRTPLDSASVNASIRWAVLARGAVGVYEGGGLLLADQSLLTGGQARAALRGGTLRLAAASAGFDDKLGSASAQGGFPLREDPATTRALAALLARASAIAKPIEEPGEAEPSLDG